jgi:murein L,D-transpeptidase YcbB/YkuD
MIREGVLAVTLNMVRAGFRSLGLMLFVSVSAPLLADEKRPTEPPATIDHIDIPAPPDLSALVERELMIESAYASSAYLVRPEQTKPPEPAGTTPAVVAVIERAPEIRLDLPLPEPFISFNRMDIDPPPAIAEAPVPPQAAEALVVLDIPPPTPVSVVIDVPRAVSPPVEAPRAEVAPVAPSTALAKLALDDQRLRALIEPYRASLRLRPQMIESFVAFYAGREWNALWIDAEGKPLGAVSALRRLAADAADEGLDADRLLLILPDQATGVVADEARAAFDVSTSLAAWLYAHDARGGRLDPRAISAMFTPKLTIPLPADVLTAIDGQADGQAVTRILARYQPQHTGYRALRTELARLRAAENVALTTASVGDGGGDRPTVILRPFMGDQPLQIGQSDPRVPQMRARLGLPVQDDLRYTGDIVEAVKAFQRANDLTPNGRITPRTRAALDDHRAPATPEARPARTDQRIGTVIANMERWRWLPDDLGKTHIFVNVPEFRMEMHRDGQRVFETRVIVGKPETQTPIFSDEMEFLVVNPSWTVPPTIMKKEFLPRLAADPEYAARRGFELIRRGNAVSVRQPPGEQNALGLIKFMFPNDHAVYLHDTPTRHLFGSATRAYSHGCVRVEGPFRLAEHILSPQGFDEKALRGMVGRGERTIRLTQRFPVHLAYFTLIPSANGELVSKPDLYGHDLRIRRALAI